MPIKVCNVRLDKRHLELDLEQLNTFLDTVTVKLTTSNFVTTGTSDYWSVLIFYEPKKRQVIPKATTDLPDVDKEKLEQLKTWRNIKAAELNLPHYMISHNSELVALAINQPKTLSELKQIRGFGETKIAKYGQDILAVLKT